MTWFGNFEINAHGGECCGINHVHDFGEAPNEARLENLKKAVAGFKQGGEGYFEACEHEDEDGEQIHPRKGLLEATLTDHQMRGWWPELEKRGWKNVFRFFNSNSGNHVNLLVLDVQDDEL